jgi:hypothetical protein
MHRRRDISIIPAPCLPGAEMNTVAETVRLHRDSLPIAVPADYVGPLTLPGNGRTVYWTGRVAIGLRHQAQRSNPTGQSALWIQDVLLAA